LEASLVSPGRCERITSKQEETGLHTGLHLDSQDFHLYRDSALLAIALSHMRRINALPG
jgi:hypothetical protein